MNDKNKGMGSVAAGVVGGAVGMAVGAAAVALSDEKNRKKALKVVDTFRTRTTKTIKDLRKQMPAMNGHDASKVAATVKKKIVSKQAGQKST